MELGAILKRIRSLPQEAQDELLSTLKLSDIQYTHAGAVLVAMQLLSLLGVPQRIDQVLGEEHTSLAQLKADYRRGEKTVPSSGIILSLLVADMLAYPREITRIYKIEELAHDWCTAQTYVFAQPS